MRDVITNADAHGVITNADAHYALGIVEAICAKVGLGLRGSRLGRERAAIIRNELESHLGAGNAVCGGGPWS